MQPKLDKPVNAVTLLKQRYGKLKKNHYTVYLRGGNKWFGNELIIHSDDLFEMRDVEGNTIIFPADGFAGISYGD